MMKKDLKSSKNNFYFTLFTYKIKDILKFIQNAHVKSSDYSKFQID